MKELLARLTSRKFLMSAVGAAALYSIGQYSEMVMLILGFVGVEGGADIVSKYKSRTLTAQDIETAVSHNVDDSPDTSKIVTGSTPLFNEKPKE